MFLILALLTILTMWYVSNNPFAVPQKQLEQIQQEEGLK